MSEEVPQTTPNQTSDALGGFMENAVADNTEFELVPCVVIPDEDQNKKGASESSRQRRRSSWNKPRPKSTRPRKNSGDGSADQADQEMLEPEQPENAVDEATAYALILEQLEHYFSVKNLCRDVFMRSYMDCEGWVPLPFLSDFNCIRSVSDDLDLVRKCARDSELLEWNEEHDKLRLKENWGRWLFPNPHTGGHGLPLWQRNQTQPGLEVANGGGDREESTDDAPPLPTAESGRRMTASSTPFVPGGAPASKAAPATQTAEEVDLIANVDVAGSDFFSQMAAAVDATVDRDEQKDGTAAS